MLSANISYKQFAVETKRMLEAQLLEAGADDAAHIQQLIKTAERLIEREERKAEYQKGKAAKSRVSDTTLTNAKRIELILSTDPLTGAEIAEKLGEAWTALQISNYIRYIPNCERVRVSRTVKTGMDRVVTREYSAYKITE